MKEDTKRIQEFVEYLGNNYINVEKVMESNNAIVLEFYEMIQHKYKTVYYGPILKEFLYEEFYGFLLQEIKDKLQRKDEDI